MNAKQELLEVLLRTASTIKCAKVSGNILLKIGHSGQEYVEFLNKLNFEYDNGIGGESFSGTVWINDDNWLIRQEYDGSGYWKFCKLPNIPDELK